MTSLEQIQQEIQTLPQEALDLLAVYVQLLKQLTFTVTPSHRPLQEAFDPGAEGSVYERFEASGLIGCVALEEHLSTTYKQVLDQELSYEVIKRYG